MNESRADILREAIARVEDPCERAMSPIGLGLGWESAREVLRRMLFEALTDSPPCGSSHDFAQLGIARCQRPAGHEAQCPHMGRTEAGTLFEWPAMEAQQVDAQSDLTGCDEARDNA